MSKIQKLKNNIIFMFLLYFLIYLIIIPEISLFYNNTIMIVIFSLIFCLIYIYLNRDEFEDFLKKLMTVCKNSINIGYISILVILINITCTTINEYLGYADNLNQRSLIEIYNNIPMLYSFYIIVITPVVEELVFKSVLYKKSQFFNDNKKIKRFIICTIFAGLHLLNEIVNFKVYVFIDFINYFLFSFITLNKYEKENNILYPILIHMLCNFVALYL